MPGQLYAWGSNIGGVTDVPEGNDFVEVAAGNNHAIALRADGSLVGWGSNTNGQTDIPEGNDFKDITASVGYSLALRADGTLVGWGGRGADRATPPAGNDYIAVEAGPTEAIALRANGEIVGWAHHPSNDPPLGNDFIAISAFNSHKLALKADGSVVAWGSNFFGEGDVPPGNEFIAVAAGGFHSLALKVDGTVVGWGLDSFGQVSMPDGIENANFIAIDAGETHSVALKADGTLVAWGRDFAEQTVVPASANFTCLSASSNFSIAIGSPLESSSPSAVYYWGAKSSQNLSEVPSSHALKSLAVGGAHALGLRTDGSIVAWGSNEEGQASPPSGNHFKAIAAGEYHSLALRADGSIVGWGDNIVGQASPPSENEFVAIAARENQSLALRSDGSVVGWGTEGFASIEPPEPPSENGFKAIAAGARHGLALRADGSIEIWGADFETELGMPEGGGFKAIASSPYHSLALAADGSVVGWGLGSSGQLTAPPGIEFVSIVAGRIHSHGLNAAGEIFSWGSNVSVGENPPIGTGFTEITVVDSFGLAIGPNVPPTPRIIAPEAAEVFRPVDRDFALAEFAFTDVRVRIDGRADHLDQIELLRDNEQVPGGEPTLEGENTYVYKDVRLDPGVHQLSVYVTDKDGGARVSEPVWVYVTSFDGIDDCFWEAWEDHLENRPEEPATPTAMLGASLWRSLASNDFVRTITVAALDLDLDAYRQFRDEVLAQTPAGLYYTDLYERLSVSLIEVALTDPGLVGPIDQAVEDWTPLISALVGGTGGDVAITPEVAEAAQSLLAMVRAGATGDLAEIMDAETAALDPATWSGMTAEQLLDRFESQVRPAPSIVVEPAGATQTAGEELILAVEAEGAGPLTYQWHRGGVAIAGATDAVLALPSAQAFHAGNYTVTVTNPFGETSSANAPVTISAAPDNEARLLNLSTRALSLTGDDVLIPGFVIQGSDNKRVLIRAVGPTLTDFGLSTDAVLPNPRMSLQRWDGDKYVEVSSNDDWGDNPNVADILSTSENVFAFGLDEGSADAVLLVDLSPGLYTVVCDDSAGATGIAIVELFDADDGTVDSRLINISNRGFAGMDADVMIPGFVVSEEGPKSFLLRAVGPTLTSFGVTGAMADPRMTLYRSNPDGTQTELFVNDDWGENLDPSVIEAAAETVSAFALPTGSADAALVLTLEAGAYTIHGGSADGQSTGTILVEVYVVP